MSLGSKAGENSKPDPDSNEKIVFQMLRYMYSQLILLNNKNYKVKILIDL